jgi:hypothetical protein
MMMMMMMMMMMTTMVMMIMIMMMVMMTMPLTEHEADEVEGVEAGPPAEEEVPGARALRPVPVLVPEQEACIQHAKRHLASSSSTSSSSPSSSNHGICKS